VLQAHETESEVAWKRRQNTTFVEVLPEFLQGTECGKEVSEQGHLVVQHWGQPAGSLQCIEPPTEAEMQANPRTRISLVNRRIWYVKSVLAQLERDWTATRQQALEVATVHARLGRNSVPPVPNEVLTQLAAGRDTIAKYRQQVVALECEWQDACDYTKTIEQLRFNREERQRLRMPALPTCEPTWQDWLRDKPAREAQRLYEKEQSRLLQERLAAEAQSAVTALQMMSLDTTSGIEKGYIERREDVAARDRKEAEKLKPLPPANGHAEPGPSITQGPRQLSPQERIELLKQELARLTALEAQQPQPESEVQREMATPTSQGQEEPEALQPGGETSTPHPRSKARRKQGSGQEDAVNP
jgi:hypothetical protein